MYCSHCGSKVLEHANYCSQCGRKLIDDDESPNMSSPVKVYTVQTALTDYFQGALGETKLRELLRTGEIAHSRAGARILIREKALDAWLAAQEKESPQPGCKTGHI